MPLPGLGPRYFRLSFFFVFCLFCAFPPPNVEQLVHDLYWTCVSGFKISGRSRPSSCLQEPYRLRLFCSSGFVRSAGVWRLPLSPETRRKILRSKDFQDASWKWYERLERCIAVQGDNYEAIVGAGIGGTSAAYFLRQEFGPGVKIDVYESGTVGGRLATVAIDGRDYETGGSIIHPLNLHMKHFVDKLGLSIRAEVPTKMAIFNGKELTFEESDWFIINFLRMMWNYGFNPLRLHIWVEGLLDKFMRIYQYQQFSYSFSTVERMLHAMNGDEFLALLNQTLEEAMLAHGFSQTFINEIVTPISRVNYGQSVRLHAFVGAIALAGAESGLWAVDGGNKRVCSGLLYHSKAELIPARVTNIALKTRPSKSGTITNFYELNYVGDSGSAHSLYDIVVLATPLHLGLSDISFSGFSPALSSHFPGHYHQTVSTLVHGRLNVSFLDAKLKASDFFVSDIFTTDGEKLGISSLSCLDPVHITPDYTRPPASQTAVWKVFSPEPLTEEQLKTLFISREHVSEKRWLAYPSYKAPERQAPPFILHHSLYYLSPIEWAASAMEMSALSAQNVALLANHRWHGNTEKVDQEGLHARLRGEL